MTVCNSDSLVSQNLINASFATVLMVSGFEQSVYSVSEEDSSVTICANLASPVVQRSAMVTFQTAALPNSAIGKQTHH